MTTFLSPSLSCQIPNINAIYQRYFDGTGVFVEVGANDGYSWSNTWHLAQAGWQGLYFEPVEELANICWQKHICNNVEVIQAAVGSFDGFTKLYTGEGATTSDYVARNNTFGYGNSPDKFVMVPACTLNTALRDHEIPHDFDLLVIDVDGDEVGVLRGLDLSLWCPTMIIIETSKDHPNKSWRFNCQGIEARLKAQYQEIYHDHINSIFVRKDADMLSLFRSKVELILKVAGWYNCTTFVETGTGGGDMLDEVYPYFQQVYSVELDPNLYRNAQGRFWNAANVQLYHGDSGAVLAQIVPTLKGVTLFYLDAHFSGLGTARGSKETPILAELQTILKSPGSGYVILIDDLKHFIGTNDYPTQAALKKFTLDIRPKAEVEIIADGGGMILIVPGKKKRNLTRKLEVVTLRAVGGVMARPGQQAPGFTPRSFERPPILYGPYREGKKE